MANSPEEIKKAVKSYMIVGVLLFICTFITYAVANYESLDVGDHGFDIKDAIIGILIAMTKASLVAVVFMHLNHEKKAIYWIFFGALFFGLALIALTGFGFLDPIIYDEMLPELKKS